MRQKHGGTQHHKWGVLVSAFSSASAAATSAAFSPLHVVFIVDMAGDSPIIVPALKRADNGPLRVRLKSSFLAGVGCWLYCNSSPRNCLRGSLGTVHVGPANSTVGPMVLFVFFSVLAAVLHFKNFL